MSICVFIQLNGHEVPRETQFVTEMSITLRIRYMEPREGREQKHGRYIPISPYCISINKEHVGGDLSAC